MKIDLVYNPAAGNFRQSRLDALVAAFTARGATVTPVPSRVEGDWLSGEADLVCVHGGDGTLRDTVQALGNAASRVPLAIAPSGTISMTERARSAAFTPRLVASARTASRKIDEHGMV